MIKKLLLVIIIGAVLGVGMSMLCDNYRSLLNLKTNHLISPLTETNPYKVKVYKSDNGVSIIRIVSEETNEEYTIISTDKGNILVPNEKNK